MVIPAKAGIQRYTGLDSCLRRSDETEKLSLQSTEIRSLPKSAVVYFIQKAAL